MPSFSNSNNGDCQAFPTPTSSPSLTVPSCRFHQTNFNQHQEDGIETVLNKLWRVVPRLIANFLSFLFKNKNYTIFACFHEKSSKNHQENYYIQNEADWQSSFFNYPCKPRALGTKADKNARLDRGECASFPDLDYQALGILDSVLSLAQTQPQLVLYHPEKKTSYSASEYAAQQNNFRKTGQL